MEKAQLRSKRGAGKWDQCEECGRRCFIRHGSKPVCSNSCRRAFSKRRSRESEQGVSPGTVGAISELMVCADLMRRGYAVFRAISPSCHCDLMITHGGGSALRVEVKTGHLTAAGKRVGTQIMNYSYDVLALSFDEGIFYLDPSGQEIIMRSCVEGGEE